MKLTSRRRCKNLLKSLKRNWEIFFFILLIFIIIYYKLVTRFKLSDKNFKIVRGNYLESFKSDEKILNSTSNLNVFFIDGDVGDEKLIDDGRWACSVESAAHFNPHMTIYLNLLTASSKLFLHDSILSKALLSYKNIKIRLINFEEYFKGTMLEEWFRHDPLWTYSVDQVADVTKMLMLNRHGGVAMDFNIIALKSFKNISDENFACLLDKRTILPSLIKLTNNETGLKFSDSFILKVLKSFEFVPASDEVEKFELNLKQNYFSEDQGAPPPATILKNIIKNSCEGNLFKANETTKCDGFHVLPVTRCAPAFYRNFKKFFQERNSRFVFDKLKDAYFVHMWSGIKETGKLSLKSKAALSVLVKKVCPRVAEVLKEI